MSVILGWIIGAMLIFAVICLALWAPLVAFRLILRLKNKEEPR